MASQKDKPPVERKTYIPPKPVGEIDTSKFDEVELGRLIRTIAEAAAYLPVLERIDLAAKLVLQRGGSRDCGVRFDPALELAADILDGVKHIIEVSPFGRGLARPGLD